MSCCGKNNLLQGCNSSCDFQWTMSYNPNTDYFPITAYPGVFNSLIIIYYLGPSGSVTVIACKSRELFCLTPPNKPAIMEKMPSMTAASLSSVSALLHASFTH